MSYRHACVCLLSCVAGLIASALAELWFLAFLFLMLAVWSSSECATARRDRALLLPGEPPETSFLSAVLMHGRILLQRGKTIYLNTRGRLL